MKLRQHEMMLARWAGQKLFNAQAGQDRRDMLEDFSSGRKPGLYCVNCGISPNDLIDLLELAPGKTPVERFLNFYLFFPCVDAPTQLAKYVRHQPAPATYFRQPGKDIVNSTDVISAAFILYAEELGWKIPMMH